MSDPNADAPEAAPSTETDWPRAGDVGYIVWGWDAGDDAGAGLDAISRELRVFFVPGRNGALHHVGPEQMTDLDQPQKADTTPYDPKEVKRTLAESLRESASQEREYGKKCLTLAETLERLAAEAEGAGPT
jgi:hypothetical protein